MLWTCFGESIQNNCRQTGSKIVVNSKIGELNWQWLLRPWSLLVIFDRRLMQQMRSAPCRFLFLEFNHSNCKFQRSPLSFKQLCPSKALTNAFWYLSLNQTWGVLCCQHLRRKALISMCHAKRNLRGSLSNLYRQPETLYGAQRCRGPLHL